MGPSPTLLERLIQAVTENLGLKLLALIFAVGIWAWAQTEQVVDSRVRVRLDYQWPEDLVRVAEVPGTLVVVLSGPQGLVRTVNARDLRVPVDFSSAEEGPAQVEMAERLIEGLPIGLSVQQILPPAIEVEFDQPLSRPVRVKPLVIGEPAEGFRRVSVRVEPQALDIVGPQRLVRNLAEVPTDIVDISGVRETRSWDVPLAFTKSSIRTVDGQPVKVTVELEAEIADRTFSEVPVEAPKGWQAQPETAMVVLRGPVHIIGQIPVRKLGVVLSLPPVPDGEERDPEQTSIELAYRPEASDALVRVEHPGNPELVLVDGLNPISFVLERVP